MNQAECYGVERQRRRKRRKNSAEKLRNVGIKWKLFFHQKITATLRLKSISRFFLKYKFTFFHFLIFLFTLSLSLFFFLSLSLKTAANVRHLNWIFDASFRNARGVIKDFSVLQKSTFEQEFKKSLSRLFTPTHLVYNVHISTRSNAPNCIKINAIWNWAALLYNEMFTLSK